MPSLPPLKHSTVTQPQDGPTLLGQKPKIAVPDQKETVESTMTGKPHKPTSPETELTIKDSFGKPNGTMLKLNQ